MRTCCRNIWRFKFRAKSGSLKFRPVLFEKECSDEANLPQNNVFQLFEWQLVSSGYYGSTPSGTTDFAPECVERA